MCLPTIGFTCSWQWVTINTSLSLTVFLTSFYEHTFFQNSRDFALLQLKKSKFFSNIFTKFKLIDSQTLSKINTTGPLTTSVALSMLQKILNPEIYIDILFISTNYTATCSYRLLRRSCMFTWNEMSGWSNCIIIISG